MAEDANSKKSEGDIRIAAGRSPAYPYVDLAKAVHRVEQMRDAGAARSVLPPEVFYKIWGIGPQSSGARQTMAALNHFGLVSYIGRGDDRKIQLTDLALKIVLDKRPGSQDRVEALRTAALEPPIHAELFEKYGSFLPADVVLETYLVKDRGYNQQAATNLLDEYKATLAFAGLDKPDNMSVPEAETENAAMHANVAENQSVSREGPPTSEVGREPPPSIVSSEQGEREWLRGPLSKEVKYRLVVAGDMGPREIGKLIKILEAQKAVLEDDDGEDG